MDWRAIETREKGTQSAASVGRPTQRLNRKLGKIELFFFFKKNGQIKMAHAPATEEKFFVVCFEA